MTCSRCPNDRPLANLTRVGDELVCPECLYAEAVKGYTRQVLAPPPAVPTPPPAHGLVVIDIQRGMAGRRAALARRRARA